MMTAKSGGAVGLSPPTRGNLPDMSGVSERERSIPAHAGEPSRARSGYWTPPVYPRPRGGTERATGGARPTRGLSPPTRGNHAGFWFTNGGRRSIPAHAGEPTSASCAVSTVKVYPRPRGGTLAAALLVSEAPGLSPPTRGNRFGCWLTPAIRRSIPAHAGEPLTARRGLGAKRVYPRPRGGTVDAVDPADYAGGLSPPTWGNLRHAPAARFAARSIPAHAGEPTDANHARRSVSVYPRPRGGTTPSRRADPYVDGLSPPTRGNRCMTNSGTRTFRVYPRPRGGTPPACKYG